MVAHWFFALPVCRFAGLVRNAITQYGKNDKKVNSSATIFGDISPETSLTLEQFEDLLKKIDNCLRALPATAQVARQQVRHPRSSKGACPCSAR